MAFLLDSEPLISFRAAADLVPTRPDGATVWRWAMTGVNGRRLQCYRIGGRWFTTESALHQFLAQPGESDGE